MEELTIKLATVHEVEETVEFLKPSIVTYSGFFSKRVIKVVIRRNKKKLLLNCIIKEKKYYTMMLRELRKICSWIDGTIIILWNRNIIINLKELL